METGFIHMVYFWGRPDANMAATGDEAKLLAAGAKKHLPGIPGVLRLSVARPAPDNSRPVVDDTYSVALLVEFADAAGEEVYQNHPDHLAFIAECSKYWSKVKVYDSVL